MLRTEWLETNGRGGWASGTVSGIHTRRYHGLLVDGSRFPHSRAVLIAKADETLSVQGCHYQLGSNIFPDVVHPQGFLLLEEFSGEVSPRWVWRGPWGDLIKRLVAIHNECSVVVEYLLRAAAPGTLSINPLFAARNYHELRHADATAGWRVEERQGEIQVTLPQPWGRVFFGAPDAEWHEHPSWYHRFDYLEEYHRGFEHREDLLSLGQLSVVLMPDVPLRVLYSSQPVKERDAAALVNDEITRRTTTVLRARTAVSPPRTALPNERALFDLLVRAGDQFIVTRADGQNSIVAGYHWFTDWGRDSMISLPGLCCVTGRFEEARSILRMFLEHVRDGLIPNRFPDSESEVEYNSIDGTLWAFVAVWSYLHYSRDRRTVLEEFYPRLCEMAEVLSKGTVYGIFVDDDQLMHAGSPGTQLTWMDARVDGAPVTSRHGLPVEVNSLWYNALEILAALAAEALDRPRQREFEQRAERCRMNFRRVFTTPEGLLYDCISPEGTESALRPNQVFALSLPFPLLTGSDAAVILESFARELLTPFGLRSLSPRDPRYQGRCHGDARSRDRGYHQGTVWSWLLGPYCTALIRVYGDAGREEVRAILQRFTPHLRDAGFNTISEIFDGDPPHRPRGCIAQAWSVAELLRMIVEDLWAIGDRDTFVASR